VVVTACAAAEAGMDIDHQFQISLLRQWYISGSRLYVRDALSGSRHIPAGVDAGRGLVENVTKSETKTSEQ
jgi:hypothetical protein